jgi:exopolyphosphatase / guanosine-5'-triphosphate,3'-diphosphate pyrophosphatase
LPSNIQAAIDLGTNTCLLLIAQVDLENNLILKVLEDFSFTVRLGQGVDASKELLPQAMQRTLECLENYALIVQGYGIPTQDVKAVATSQARDAKNGKMFFDVVSKQTGFQFKTLSGEQEALMTFRGALPAGKNPEKIVVIDIGGGSTEITSIVQGVVQGQSVDLGCVRFTERFLKSDLVTDSEFWACLQEVDQGLAVFEKIYPNQFQGELLAVAGTATTLAQLHLGLSHFDKNAIEGVHRLLEELKMRTLAERRLYLKDQEKRADVILAGAIILWRALEVLGFRSCRVSTRGLRYGVLLAENTLVH